MRKNYQVWYGVTLEEAKDKVGVIFNEAMFWKPDLFEPPKCHLQKKLIKLIVGLVNVPHSNLIMTTLMIIPQLLLQKQHEHSTRTENIKCLKKRIQLWKEGELNQLRKEAVTLNDRFARKYRTARENDNESAKSANLMKKGKIGPSLRLLQENKAKAPPNLAYSFLMAKAVPSIHKQITDGHVTSGVTHIGIKAVVPHLHKQMNCFTSNSSHAGFGGAVA